MARNNSFRLWLTFTWALSLLSPQTYFVSTVCAQEATTPKLIRTTDVSLDADHHMRGKVVSAEGQPAANAAVQVFRDNRLVTTAKTNANGEFLTATIAGGTYQLVTACQSMPLRVWTQNTAPPSAIRDLLVAETGVLRGQCHSTECQILNCDGSCGAGAYCGSGIGMLIHPLVIGAAIAAAIAVPLALDDDDDDAS